MAGSALILQKLYVVDVASTEISFTIEFYRDQLNNGFLSTWSSDSYGFAVMSKTFGLSSKSCSTRGSMGHL